jgi:hypothetical protein
MRQKVGRLLGVPRQPDTIESRSRNKWLEAVSYGKALMAAIAPTWFQTNVR